ncbi:uncharacterized protein [Lolium perenne]|uniref:uncharacterized protein n=1 Tax=Lolium perenne TaxID=4522 RepID=UPI0021F50623|nr:uncharacterized protein LOC127331805 [Lolium perenne]
MMDPPAPNRKRRRSPVLGSLKSPFVYVPGDGTKVGRFVPRGSGAQYCFPDQPPPPPGCEEKELVPGPSVPAAQAVQQNVSSSILMPGITTCHESPITAAYFPSPQQPSLFPQQPPWLCPYQPISPHSHYPQRPLGRRLTPSLGSPFLRRVQFQWGVDFYIRIDHAGYYHTYPHVGGIYQTLQEAERGIECYLHGRRDPKMFKMDNVSPVDIAVRQCLYYPDGARRRPLRSEPVDEIRDSKLQLVYALVDKYNEDNNLFGDRAYEINAVGCYQAFCEGDVSTWYHHINFTAKTKGAVYSDVFFAEVIFMLGDSEELPVSCLYIVKPTDNGNCFGCMNHGNFDMKHPNDVGYVGGHVLNTFMPFNGPKLCFDDEDLEAEEARLRSSLQCLDSPQFNPPCGLAKKYPGPPGFLGSGIPGLYF